MIRLAVIAVLLTTPVLAQDLIVPFVDEAQNDSDFAAWRAELMLDVIARDTEAVVAKAAPDIALSFGGDGGRETFTRWLETGDGSDDGGEAFWRALETVLVLGGTFGDAEAFTAPYIFTAELPETLDVYSTHLVLGLETPIHKGPGVDTPILATVTGAVIETIDYDDYEAPFRLVRRADGSEGYVATDRLRAVIDYRALFNRVDGVWQITAFVAGD
jgi:hypothetical protein